MKFLDQQLPHTDVYFSTWNVTTTVNNPQRGDLTNYGSRQDYIRDIPGSEIKHMFGNCRAVKIQDFSKSRNVCDGIPLVKHWRWGLDLVKESGIKYDYILLLRPDLFFSNNSYFNIDLFPQYENAIGVDPVPGTAIMTDTILFSTYENIFNFVYNFDANSCIAKKLDWHSCLYDYVVNELKLEIKGIPITGRTSIGRYGITEDWTIDEVEQLYYESMR